MRCGGIDRIMSMRCGGMVRRGSLNAFVCDELACTKLTHLRRGTTGFMRHNLGAAKDRVSLVGY